MVRDRLSRSARAREKAVRISWLRVWRAWMLALYAMKASATALATAPRNSARCSPIQSLVGDADFQVMKTSEDRATKTTATRQDLESSPIRALTSEIGTPIYSIQDFIPRPNSRSRPDQTWRIDSAAVPLREAGLRRQEVFWLLKRFILLDRAWLWADSLVFLAIERSSGVRWNLRR